MGVQLFQPTPPVRSWVFNNLQTLESYWSLELCIEEAAKYKNRAEWEQSSPISYFKAIKRGWLTKCMKHDPSFRRKPSMPETWTFEKCIILAKTCKSRKEFKTTFSYPYEKARLKGWLDVCCSHMK